TTQSFHCRMSSSAHGLPPTPTFPLSLHAALPIFRNAAIHAIEHGATRYAAAPGIQPLREAIARDLANRTGRDIDAAGVVVTAGAKQAIFNACFVLFGPGDRVLFPAPYWTSYPDIVRLARAEPVPVTGDPGRGYK